MPPKRPYLFHSLSPKDPHFNQLSPNDPLFLTNSLSPKDLDTSLSLKDPSPSHANKWQFSVKNQIFQKFRQIWRMLRNFWPFWPWKALLFDAFHWKTPYFLRFVTERSPFLTQFVTERPLHLRCLVALVRHFHMWVPPTVSSTVLYKTYIASQEKSGCVFGITCRRGKYCKTTIIRVSTERKWVVKELQAKLRMTLIFVRVCTLFYKDIVYNLHLQYIQRYEDLPYSII